MAGELDVAADFSRLEQAFDAAGSACGSVLARTFRIGGATMRLRFAGPALVEPVTRAFSHLAVERSAAVDLDVAVWDDATTGGTLPAISWLAGRRSAPCSGRGFDVGPYTGTFNTGEILGINQRGIRGAYSTGDGLLQAFHVGQRRAVMWIANAGRYPFYESAAPLRRIFHWWSQVDAAQLTHAAAVGTPELGAVLVVGVSGSGKSTTSLACIGSPLKFVGDDYVLLRRDPEPTVYSLYGTGKLEPHHLPRLDRFRADVDNAGRMAEEKAVVNLTDRHAAHLIDRLPVRCIVLPRVVPGGTTSIRPLPRPVAFRAVAPSTVYQSPGAGAADFAFLADFVRRLPCRQLELGADIESVPGVLRDLLASL
jgi:hypothetical protein